MKSMTITAKFMFWRGWGKSITTSNPKIWSSGWLQTERLQMRPFSKSWRSIHEKVTYVAHDSLLPDPDRRAWGSISFQCPVEQRPIVWADSAMSTFSFNDDEIYGT